MTEVIDITGKLKVKQLEQEHENYRKNHDYVLTACEEVFNEAVVVEICEDGSINLSTTDIDEQDAIDALVSAAFKLQELMKEEDV